MATIKDVAERAGVSTATVSYVINKNKFVSAELIQRVETAIRELNYAPSMLARSLRRGRSMTVGLLMDDIANRFGAEFTRGLEDIACRSEYSVIISDLHKDMVDERANLDLLLEKQVDGIIYSGYGILEERLLELHRDGMPIIAVDKPLGNDEIPSVLIDQVSGTNAALQYLSSLGHSRIVYVAGLYKNPNSRIRAIAFRRFMESKGHHVDDTDIRFGDYTLAHGYGAAIELVEEGRAMTAIFCADDLVAFGVIAGLKTKGVRVPEDVSVVSFGNDPIAQYFDPPLTTINYPMSEMGVQSFELFRELVTSADNRGRTVVLPTELVVRSSATRV